VRGKQVGKRIKEEGMKKLLAIGISALLALTMMAVLPGCGQGLDGTYTSVDGKYTIEFDSDGTVVWRERGTFFNGTYKRVDDGDGDWRLDVVGSSLAMNTSFDAHLEDGDLIVSGGSVKAEDNPFTKVK
jgi:hypothetical protein